MKNLDIALRFVNKGSVLLIPQVTFDTGVTKAKYCVALEDGSSFWKRGRCLLACFTTSKPPGKLKSWQVEVPAEYKILGESQAKTTYIDCRNRINLTEDQIKKCKYIGELPPEILIKVNNANEIAEQYARLV